MCRVGVKLLTSVTLMPGSNVLRCRSAVINISCSQHHRPFVYPSIHPSCPPFVLYAIILIHEGTGGGESLHYMSSTYLDRTPIIRAQRFCSVNIFQPSIRLPTTPVHAFVHLIHLFIHPLICILSPVNLPFVHLPIHHL